MALRLMYYLNATPKNGVQRPPPLFGPCSLWPSGSMDQDATWYGGRPWPRPHCVRWGPSSTPQKRHSHPQFSAYVCCGQTTGWIKMPLGTEVGLGPGDIVRWGTQLPPKKGHSFHFLAHVYCGQTSRFIKMPVGTVVGLSPGDIVLDGAPSSPKKAARPLPTFQPMSIVAKWWSITATAEH